MAGAARARREGVDTTVKPREEMIAVGETKVHVLIGGTGSPLLVLHGAGGNRGWRRWMDVVAMSYEELVGNYYIVAGTPDEVVDRFARVREELGIGHLLLEAQESRMDNATTARSI